MIRIHVRNALSLSGIFGPLILATTTIICHFFRENYDWVHQTISQLGLGPHGWIENTGFIIFGVCMVIFADALYRGFQSRRSHFAATIAWVLIGIGFILIGIFHANASDAQHTLHGLIHISTAITLAVFFPVTCFILIPSFKGNPYWNNMVAYTISTAVVAIILDSLHFILFHHLVAHWIGLYERLILFNAIVWLEVVAIRLLSYRGGRR